MMRRLLVLGCALVVLGAGCGWERTRFDAGNTGSNPFESKISSANVGTMRYQFQVQSLTTGTMPKFVVARRHIYVTGSVMAVYSSDGIDGCINISRTCFPLWTLDGPGVPEVQRGAVYGPSNGGRSAGYDADGIAGCSGSPKVCRPTWTEQVAVPTNSRTDPSTLHYVRYTTSSILAYPVSCFQICAPVWGGSVGTTEPGDNITGPSLANTTVFAAYARTGQNGTLLAFDGTQGFAASKLWSAPLDGASGSIVLSGSGIVVVQVQTADGTRLEAFDASGVNGCSGTPKTCAPLWSTDAVLGGTDAPPALSRGVLYRSVGSQLRAYDAAGVAGCSGSPKVCTPLWTAPVGPDATAPAVANGLVYVSASDGRVAAFDAAGVIQCSSARGCNALWETNVGAAAGPVEVADGRVYVANALGFVSAYGLP